MNTEKYYVVEHCSEYNWEQISQSIDSYENAIKFKDSDFVKNRFPKAFIVSTVPSQLLKQQDDMREILKYILEEDLFFQDGKETDRTRKIKLLIESTNP